MSQCLAGGEDGLGEGEGVKDQPGWDQHQGDTNKSHSQLREYDETVP